MSLSSATTLLCSPQADMDAPKLTDVTAHIGAKRVAGSRDIF
ncbi:hypothetical protein [Xanthomonas arboricola]|nr:hypothetical protein [Xanthomonas arboricola]